MKEARLYKKVGENKTKCYLCRRGCLIGEGKRGYCRVRENHGGKLYTLVYGKPCAVNIDPVEKKPLFNFHPGSNALSIATVGCNFSCLHCQNWEISQAKPEDYAYKEYSPKQLVELASESGCGGIAYTYTEPTVFYEYAYDTMVLAKEKKLYNAWVTNGYMSKECLQSMKGLLDAANVDVKGNEEFYENVCGNIERKHVLENIKTMHKMGVHVEITYLIIPGYNDNEKDYLEIIGFVKKLDPTVPLHFTRFYPHYKMKSIQPTPYSSVSQARETALREGLKYVYTGNVDYGDEGENTYCPECGEVVIKRNGYNILKKNLEKNACKNCGHKLKNLVP